MALVAEALAPPLTIEDLMDNVAIMIDFGGLEFDTAGSHDFRLWAGDRFLDSTSLRVDLLDSREGN